MTGCAICGQRNVDGAIDDCGDYICIDCWASGEAGAGGRYAVIAVPAITSYHVDYPPEMHERFLRACNNKK